MKLQSRGRYRKVGLGIAVVSLVHLSAIPGPNADISPVWLTIVGVHTLPYAVIAIGLLWMSPLHRVSTESRLLIIGGPVVLVGITGILLTNLVSLSTTQLDSLSAGIPAILALAWMASEPAIFNG